jgi:hypothetical protein
VHPGVVLTDLQRHWDTSFFSGAKAMFYGLGSLFLKNAEEGAQTTIYCSVDRKLANKTGLYYRLGRFSCYFAKRQNTLGRLRLTEKILIKFHIYTFLNIKISAAWS